MTGNQMTGETMFPHSLAEGRGAFLQAVYGWMAGGLALTAATAWVVAGSPVFANAVAANGFLFWGLAIAQIAIVVVLSARVERLSTSAASLLFLVYSALTGVTVRFDLAPYDRARVHAVDRRSAVVLAAVLVDGRRR